MLPAGEVGERLFFVNAMTIRRTPTLFLFLFLLLAPGLFAAGDMRTGQSLVVRALADGRAAAREVHRWLGVAER